MGRFGACVRENDHVDLALFTANKDVALECKIRKALAGLGTIEIERFPDGEPYSVHFTFTTKGA